MINHIVSRVATRVPAAARGFTHQTWVAGMPRKRIPFAEKLVHGAIIAFGVWVGPCWILTHLDVYQGKDKKE